MFKLMTRCDENENEKNKKFYFSHLLSTRSQWSEKKSNSRIFPDSPPHILPSFVLIYVSCIFAFQKVSRYVTINISFQLKTFQQLVTRLDDISRIELYVCNFLHLILLISKDRSEFSTSSTYVAFLIGLIVQKRSSHLIRKHATNAFDGAGEASNVSSNVEKLDTTTSSLVTWCNQDQK